MRSPALIVLLLFATLALGAVAAWGATWWLHDGVPHPTDPDPVFKASRHVPITLHPGRPRTLPVAYGDFLLTCRVKVPRGRLLDLVFRLETGPRPMADRGDDRDRPQGPLYWAGLRLSAGDLGEPFFNSLAVPDPVAGGARVPPGMLTDVNLRVEGRGVSARVGSRTITWTDPGLPTRGLVALVGEGEVEGLRITPLRRRPSSLLWGLAGVCVALLLPLVWRILRPLLGTLVAWPVAALLLAGAGWLLAGTPSPREGGTPPVRPAGYTGDWARAVRRHGEADGFRNWGDYAGSLTWRGATWYRNPVTPRRRLLVLGGGGTWAGGLMSRLVTFPLQAEGWLARRRKPGEPPFRVVVAAGRKATLAGQMELCRESLLAYRPLGVLLVCPLSALAGGRGLRERLVGLADFLAARELPLVVMPPPVDPATPGYLEGCRVLKEVARETRAWYCDPAPGLQGVADPFPAAGGAPRWLGREGHLQLGRYLADQLILALGL